LPIFNEGTRLLSFPNSLSCGFRRHIVYIASINREVAEIGHAISLAQQILRDSRGKNESEVLKSLYTHGQVPELKM
jgi:hypothetical protein